MASYYANEKPYVDQKKIFIFKSTKLSLFSSFIKEFLSCLPNVPMSPGMGNGKCRNYKNW